MKRCAAIILNRNLPTLADELGDWIRANASTLVDLYIVENGSDPDKYARGANIIFKDSYGPARGINEAIKQVWDKGYEYFWINFNDARYSSPNFIKHALAEMDRDPTIGIFAPYYDGNIWAAAQRGTVHYVVFMSMLGLVISRRALDVCRLFQPVHLDPLWDSTNYSNHDNFLVTSLALHRAGLTILADTRYTVYELIEPAAQESVSARGVSDAMWKHEIGPKDRAAWYKRAFPNYDGSPKEIRERVLATITRELYKHHPELRPPLFQRLKIFIKKLIHAYF